jgi:hypothetical protein
LWHVWGEEKIIREFLWGKLQGKNTFEDLGVGEEILLHGFLRNRMGGCGLHLSSSG